MRFAVPLLTMLLTAPILEACGAKHDLVIGRSQNAGGAGVGISGSAGASGDGAGAGVAGEAGAGAGGIGGAGGVAACVVGEAPSPESLVHRYSFDGSGTALLDIVGMAHGEILGGASLDGSGVLTLDGADDYVNLPNNMISALSDATFVIWTSWRGGAGYQRIFDFGTTTIGEEQRGHGQSYVAMSPYTGRSSGRYLGALLQGTVPGETVVLSEQQLEAELPHQVALVFEGARRLQLYFDGVLLAGTNTDLSLSEVSDVNNWLGQSQWQDDHNYNGAYAEFRIYREALSPCAITSLFQAGPDVLP